MIFLSIKRVAFPKICVIGTIFVLLSVITFSRHAFKGVEFHFNASNSSQKLNPYIAVIIDDRATQQLITIVINVLQHIPADWKIQIFTHPEHWSFYNASILLTFIITNRIFMTPIDFPRGNLSGGDFINLFLTSPHLWRRIQGEKVLYFQIDSVLCSNSLYNLTQFLHYDFIGAPWAVGGCCNGGLSLRSRSKTLQLLETAGVRFPLHQINEDGWYTSNLPRVNALIAHIDVAKTFSVETIYHPRPFAVHKPQLGTIGKANMIDLCKECPETRLISTHC